MRVWECEGVRACGGGEDGGSAMVAMVVLVVALVSVGVMVSDVLAG